MNTSDAEELLRKIAEQMLKYPMPEPPVLDFYADVASLSRYVSDLQAWGREGWSCYSIERAKKDELRALLEEAYDVGYSTGNESRVDTGFEGWLRTKELE